MRKNNGYLIDYAMPIFWNFLPIITLAVYLFSCILSANDDGFFSFSKFLLAMSIPYGFAIIVSVLAYLSICRHGSIKGYFALIKPIIFRGGIILIGAMLIFGVIALSMLDIFDKAGFNFIRLFLMFGGPIIIGLFTLIGIFSIED